MVTSARTFFCFLIFRLLLRGTQPSLDFLSCCDTDQIQNSLHHLVTYAHNVLAVLLHPMLNLQIILMGFFDKGTNCLCRLKLFCIDADSEGFPAPSHIPEAGTSVLSHRYSDLSDCHHKSYYVEM